MAETTEDNLTAALVTDDATATPPVAAETTASKPEPGTKEPAKPEKSEEQSAAEEAARELESTIAGQQAKLDQLEAAIRQQQQAPTPARKRKIDELAAALQESDPAKRFDVVDGQKLLTDVLVEQSQAIDALTAKLQEQEQWARRSAQQGEAAQAAANWAAAEREYAGLKREQLTTIWDKAVEEAAGIIGENDPGVGRLATKYFHDNAKLAVKALAPPAKPAPGKPAVRGPDGKFVQNTTPAPSASDQSEAELLAPYMALVKDD